MMTALILLIPLVTQTLGITKTITSLTSACSNYVVFSGCDEVCGPAVASCFNYCKSNCVTTPAPTPAPIKIGGIGGVIPPEELWPNGYYPEESYYYLDGAKVYYFTGKWLKYPTAHQSDSFIDHTNINNYDNNDYILLKIPSNFVVPITIILALFLVLTLGLTIWNISHYVKISNGNKVINYHGVKQNSDTEFENA